MSIKDLFRRGQKESEYSEPDVTDEVYIRKDGKLVKVEVEDDDAKEGQ